MAKPASPIPSQHIVDLAICIGYMSPESAWRRTDEAGIRHHFWVFVTTRDVSNNATPRLQALVAPRHLDSADAEHGCRRHERCPIQQPRPPYDLHVRRRASFWDGSAGVQAGSARMHTRQL